MQKGNDGLETTGVKINYDSVENNFSVSGWFYYYSFTDFKDVIKYLTENNKIAWYPVYFIDANGNPTNLRETDITKYEDINWEVIENYLTDKH